jgi:hypothetical protein
MFFQNDNIDSGSCEQKSQHHARRSATGDTAARRDRLHDYSKISFSFYLREILQRAQSHVCASISRILWEFRQARLVYLDELEVTRSRLANLPDRTEGRWGEGLTAAKMAAWCCIHSREN